jgi:hypothetical protein
MSRTTQYSPFSQADIFHSAAPPSPAGAPGPHAQAPDDAARAHQELLRGLEGKQACPFCGAVSERSAGPCPRCGMENTPEARKATKVRIGPWYVLQARNPAAPGMRFDTLITFVRKGRVRARSVVRGPTTHQLWRFAAHVKGLSREFGLCFSCGSAIETTANICPQCNRLQEPPINPDVLLEAEDAPPRPAAASPVVYRELPEPLAPVAAAAAPAPAPAAPAPAPAAAPVLEPALAPRVDPAVPRTLMGSAVAAPLQAWPEDADIVIPALGAFGPDDLDPGAPEPPGTPAAATAPAVVPAAAAPAAAPEAVPPRGPAAPSPSAYPPRAAADENPFAIGRKRPNGDASFLSAKDLAAAFQLSFDPSAEMDRPVAAHPEGAYPAAGPAVATIPRNPLGPHAPPARRGGFRRFLLFVLTLSAFGLAVLMWVDPAFRQRSLEWAKSTSARWTSGSAGGGGRPAPDAQAADSFDVPMPSTAPAAGPVGDEPEPAPVAGAAPAEPAEPDAAAAAAADRPDSKSPAPPAEAAAADDADDDADVDGGAAPSEAGSADAEPRRMTPPPAPGRTAPKPAAGTAPRGTSGPRPTTGPAADDAGGGEAEEKAADAGQAEPEQAAPQRWRELYDQAFDAEDRGDYAAALRIYQQVEKLPPDEQPTNLKSKISITKRRLQRAREGG